MLKKLKRKFIFTNMVIVTLVLLVSFSTIIIINDSQRVRQVTSALTSTVNMQLSELHSADTPSTDALSTDTLPLEIPLTTDGSESPDRFQDNPTDDRTYDDDRRGMDQFIATSSYLIDPGTGTVSEALGEGVTISDEDLQTAILYALDSGQSSGRISGLGLYYELDTDSDMTIIAFASSSYVTQGRNSLLITLGIVGLCALIIFFVISLFLSRWALKPIERSWNQQQRFIADASHELKTPLTVMRANNSIILNHPNESVGSQMQWIESNESEIQTMQTLVGDMLFLAKPDSQQQITQYSQVNFSSIVDGLILQFESVAYERHLDFASDVVDGITIEGDEVRLRRLVGTLMDNALKYVDKGGRVHVSLKTDDSWATLKVTNTGEIIDAENLPHIFDRFYRADKARTRDGESYGLGLAIAKEICDEHRGTIETSSDPANGTVFTVCLPLK